MKTPIKHKDEKMASLLLHYAAEYFEKEASGQSMMTVTKAEVYDRGRSAKIFFTAIPEEKEAEALEFAKRRRSDFRHFIISKKSFGFAPRIDFAIDYGEHNRQRIDELLNNS